MDVIYVGNGFDISEENGKYQISWEQGVFGKIVHYDISKEHAYKAMRSDDDAYAVKIYAETGKWPLNEKEEAEKAKEMIRKFPKLLLKNPENQKLFDEEELKTLLEKAKK